MTEYFEYCDYGVIWHGLGEQFDVQFEKEAAELLEVCKDVSCNRLLQFYKLRWRVPGV